MFTCDAPTGSDILLQGSCSFTNGSTCGYRFSGHWRVHNGKFSYFFSDKIKDGHNSGMFFMFHSSRIVNAHVLSFRRGIVMRRFYISYIQVNMTYSIPCIYAVFCDRLLRLYALLSQWAKQWHVTFSPSKAEAVLFKI